jgi:hypothetical protein
MVAVPHNFRLCTEGEMLHVTWQMHFILVLRMIVIFAYQQLDPTSNMLFIALYSPSMT